MKNDKFPTTNMLVETIKTLLGENITSYYLMENNLRTNLLGEFIDLGYDVLRNIEIAGEESINILVRLSDGFLPIEICVNPDNREVVSQKMSKLSRIVNKYKDVRNGYFICFFDIDHNQFQNEDNKLLHQTDNDNISWWGGRLLHEEDNSRYLIEPIWTKEKLRVYGLRQGEREPQP